MEQKWLAGGAPVIVFDPGQGEPGDDDYRPALVAVPAVEYHEPAQVLDADPLAETGGDATVGVGTGPTSQGVVPGELRGPAPAPKPLVGPNAPDVVTRSTAAEDPNLTAPGSPAAVGMVSAASIVATIRELERLADAGDGSAAAELESLQAAFDADVAPEQADIWGGDDTTAAPNAGRTAADVPETGAQGAGVTAPAAGVGASGELGGTAAPAGTDGGTGDGATTTTTTTGGAPPA